MKRSAQISIALAVIGLGLAWIVFFPRPAPRSSEPLTQHAYVWQRVWDASVTDSISLHASSFVSVVPLAAEIVWTGQTASITRVPVNLGLLSSTQEKTGLALRIGPYSGPFGKDDNQIEVVADLAASLVWEANAEKVRLSELHIDFDCTDSNLDGYRLWIETLRARVSPVRVIITALPSWLNERAFKWLARAANGYVLQVHSLERPTDGSAGFKICDPAKARRWVEQASRLGVPFQVALPTYGYQAAFNPSGGFLGVSAEGAAPLWPGNSVVREIRADPRRMASLVDRWNTSRPAALSGIIWYRLPVAGDRLNWSWPTLAAVMEGRAPVERWRFEVRWREPGLAEVYWVNHGEADLEIWPDIRVRWPSGRMIAGDGLNGYHLAQSMTDTVEFAPRHESESKALSAGDEKFIGWIRFESDQVDIRVEEL